MSSYGKLQMVDVGAKKLILAGNHKEFADYLHSRYIFNIHNQSHHGHYEGTSIGATAGIHFDEIVIVGTFRGRNDARQMLHFSRLALKQGGKVQYADLHDGWYISAHDVNGDPILKDAGGHLRCNWCRALVNDTYRGGICGTCKMGKNFIKPEDGGLPVKSGGQVQTFTYSDFVKPKMTKHKEGDIWAIPKSNSPMWTNQWGYQGSAKTPYIVSLKSTDVGKNNNTTSDGWACSCMNFTRHTPRTPCKHILNVMVKEGLAGEKKSAAKLANVDDKKMAEFEAWQRDRVAAKPGKKPGDAKLALFGTTTRKFR